MFQNQNRVYYWYIALVEPRDLPTFVWTYLHLANLWNNEAVYTPLPTLQSPMPPMFVTTWPCSIVFFLPYVTFVNQKTLFNAFLGFWSQNSIALWCFFMINFHLWQVDFEKYIHNTWKIWSNQQKWCIFCDLQQKGQFLHMQQGHFYS